MRRDTISVFVKGYFSILRYGGYGLESATLNLRTCDNIVYHSFKFEEFSGAILHSTFDCTTTMIWQSSKNFFFFYHWKFLRDLVQDLAEIGFS